MINGMTGYGSKEFTNRNFKAIIEIKSLNHRYLDINYYLPTGFGSTENKIRQFIQEKIERGRITVSIKIIQKPKQIIFLNREAVKVHLQHAKCIQKEFRLKNDLTLSDILKLPGVQESKEVIVDPEKLWPQLENHFKSSLKNLMLMRKAEGRSLTQDILKNLQSMIMVVKRIKLRASFIINNKSKILSQEEFNSFLKNSDISEEISRLVHYINEVKQLFKVKGSIGKMIDFIAQEMQREVNTIGSKIQDKEISNCVIGLKSTIEKIREQSQNVE